MNKNYLLLFLFFYLISSNAQNIADSNPNFDTKDYLPKLTLYTKEFALQSNGKVIVIGNSCNYKLYNDQQSIEKNGIVRLNSDLSIDNTFQSGIGFSSAPESIAIQADDKILVSGYFTTYNGKAVQKIIRLNKNGSIDNTFNLATSGFNVSQVTNINLIKILPDDKIMISGKFDITIFQKFYGRNLIRLNSDGSVDKTFQPGTGLSYDMFKFEIQADEKIVRVYKNTFNNETSYKIDRLNPNGNIDSSFSPIEGFGQVCATTTVGYDDMFDCKLAIQDNGKIVFGGCFTKFNYIPTSGLIRFDSDGTKDSSFEYTVPGAPNAKVKNFILLPNNKILNLNLSIINEDGTSDNLPISTLDLDSKSNNFLATPDGKVIICTENQLAVNNSITTFNKFISLDLTTNKINTQRQASTYFEGNDILQNTNNEIIILGNSKNNFNIKYHDGIKLLTKNGNLIPNNNLYSNVFEGSQNNNNSFRKGVIQPDGKIIVIKYTKPSESKIVRYNPDFSVDTSFSCTITDNFTTIVLQKNGKILLSSNVQTKIYRLNNDGSVDNSFLPNFSEIGFNAPLYTIAIQNDNKILLGGSFTTYNGITTNKILRLNIDGSLDNSFLSQADLKGYIYSIAVQSDDKIIIGGENIGWENGEYVHLKRLNNDGTIDTSFNSFIAKSGHLVLKTIVEPNDKIIICTHNDGYQVFYNDEIVRLEKDGSVDSNFDTGAGFKGNISSIFRQTDGGILVTGSFTKYKDQWANGSILLNGENTTLKIPEFIFANNPGVVLFPNPTKDILTVSLKGNSIIYSIKIYNTLGQLVYSQFQKNNISTVDVSLLSKGLYSIQLNSNKELSSKFIKL